MRIRTRLRNARPSGPLHAYSDETSAYVFELDPGYGMAERMIFLGFFFISTIGEH